MKKSISSALAIAVGLGLTTSAMAATQVPYVYVYASFGKNLVKSVTVTKFMAARYNTAQGQSSLPMTVINADKNSALVTAYNGNARTPKANGSVAVNVTYHIVPMSGEPLDCTVGVSTRNIADTAPLVVTPPSGMCRMFFHPQKGKITSSAKPITINWELQQ